MKFSKCLICLFMIASLNCSFIYATESSNIDNIEANEIENEKIEEQKENLKKEVFGLVEELRVEILTIDEKIEKLRKTDEYIAYPTIRLNIDTPIFGIKSIVNQKLKITKDVSAGDVAKGYSIRDIVKNKSVKIPDFKVGNIVVSTKDISIEDELLITEYNTLVLKLMNYIDKVENVKEFLDMQANKMFKEYISKEKKEKLDDFSNRLEKINSDLLSKNKDLAKVYLAGYEEYDSLEEKYMQISKKQKELKNKSSDVLIESNKLNELQKEIISLESEVIDYLAKIYDINANNFDEVKIDEVYVKAYFNLASKLEYIEKYIESSKIEKEIKDDKKVEDDYMSRDDNTNFDNEDVKTTEMLEMYEVFSDKSVNNMKNIIASLEKRMDELNIGYNETKEDEDTQNKNGDDDSGANDNKDSKELAYNELTQQEVENEFNNIIQKYNEFLKYEYTFYLDNVNGLLSLINVKVKNIATVTDLDIIDEVKYIYIDLPVNLDKYLDTYDVNSSVEIKYLISNLKNELKNLCDNYLNVIELYEKLNVDELLNKA